MNVLLTLQPILNEVTERFGESLQVLRADPPNEIYFQARMDLVAGFCAHLYKNWQARLVSVMADDARAEEGVFHLYYVYALDAAHGFFTLRVPVAPDRPEFDSLLEGQTGLKTGRHQGSRGAVPSAIHPRQLTSRLWGWPKRQRKPVPSRRLFDSDESVVKADGLSKQTTCRAESNLPSA